MTPELTPLLVAVVGAAAAGAVLLVLRPHLAPWAVVFLFGTTAELKLRVHPGLGVGKDLLVLVLVGAVALAAVRGTLDPRTRRPPLVVWGPLAGLVVLYLLDLGGTHGSGWLFGSRLLIEALALLVLGLNTPRPDLAVRHLTAALTVFLPLQAVLAWVQQWVGFEALVYDWGYAFGRQVRLTSGGALRSPGTFEEAFSLSAFAVLAVCVAVTVASRRQAVVLWISAVAVLGATQVRTSLLELGLVLFVLLLRRSSIRAAAVSAVALVSASLVAAGFYLTSSATGPGPGVPLLLDLNGRVTAWDVAYRGVQSLVRGNGVGRYGAGSDREGGLIADIPEYNPGVDAIALLPGDPRFIDSSWLQVLSDVGLVGVLLLALWVVFHVRWLAVPLRAGHPAAWLALTVLGVGVLDWLARTTLGSFPTGFTTTYVLGVATAAALRARSRSRGRLLLEEVR